MFLKTQDLNEGDHWLHGRAWLKSEDWTTYAEVEWSIPRTGFSVSVDLGGIDRPKLSGYLQLFVVGLGWGLSLPAFLRQRTPQERHTVRVGWLGKGVGFSWRLWLPVMVSESSTPYWREGSFHPLDALFGRKRRTEQRTVESGTVAVGFPEGVYEADVKVVESTYSRSRLPWSTTRTHVKVDVEEGVPTPGKGTASYNVGQDATFGISGPGDSIQDGVEKLIMSVYRSRKRYGGSYAWLPKESRTA